MRPCAQCGAPIQNHESKCAVCAAEIAHPSADSGPMRIAVSSSRDSDEAQIAAERKVILTLMAIALVVPTSIGWLFFGTPGLICGGIVAAFCEFVGLMFLHPEAFF